MLYAVSIGDEFTDLLGNVVAVAIKVVIFLAIMGLGWLVARWIRKALASFLRRVGFDRAVERGGLDRMLGTYSASDLTARLVMFTFLLFVLQLAFGIFGPNAVSDLIAGVIAWLPRLFVAIIIVVVAAAIAGWVKELIADGLGGLSYGKALATAAQVLVLMLGIIAALNQIGVASSVTIPLLVAVLATVAGVLVVGVGGGLIKPMQHRWERVLNRAEAETSLAAERVRANRATRTATAGRDANAPSGFDQPAYGGAGATTDVKTPETAPTTEEQPTQSTPPTDRS
jgi:Mechanosensitive ion channel, conserved TM helix